MSSLLRSFIIQRRVLGALMLREVITRFGRHNLGALWLIGEPMIFTLGVAAVWTVGGLRHGAGIPMAAFALTGYSSVLLWRNSVSHCAHAIQHNVKLLFHRNVRVIDVMLTRTLLEIAGATASFIALSAFFMSIEWIKPPHDLLQVMLGWLMLAWFAVGLSLTIGAATAFSPIVERIWHPIAYLLFPFSGAAFMADWLPPSLRESLLILPMIHAVEFIREGYFGAVIPFHYDMAYMAECNLMLTLSGLWLVREAGARVEAE